MIFKLSPSDVHTPFTLLLMLILSVQGNVQETCVPIKDTSSRLAVPLDPVFIAGPEGGSYGCVTCYVTDFEVHIIHTVFATHEALAGSQATVKVNVLHRMGAFKRPVRLLLLSHTNVQYIINVIDNVQITHVMRGYFNKLNTIPNMTMDGIVIEPVVEVEVNLPSADTFRDVIEPQVRNVYFLFKNKGYPFYTSYSREVLTTEWNLTTGITSNCQPDSRPLGYLSGSTIAPPHEEGKSIKLVSLVTLLVPLAAIGLGLVYFCRRQQLKHKEKYYQDDEKYDELDEQKMDGTIAPYAVSEELPPVMSPYATSADQTTEINGDKENQETIIDKHDSTYINANEESHEDNTYVQMAQNAFNSTTEDVKEHEDVSRNAETSQEIQTVLEPKSEDHINIMPSQEINDPEYMHMKQGDTKIEENNMGS